MRRRSFVAALAAAAAGGLPSGSPVRAQEPGRSYRLGVIGTSARSLANVRSMVLPELARLGFAQDRNLVVDERSGVTERLPELMREIVDLRPDAILAISSPAVSAARATTDRVPIVSFGSDLVSLGYATSASRPGGNVTGIQILATEIEPKRLLVLAETVPHARRFGVLYHHSMSRRDAVLGSLSEVAGARGFSLVMEEVGAVPDFAAAVERLRAGGADAVLVTAHSVLWGGIETITRAAETARLATICEWTDIAGKGCVLGYGPSMRVLFERAAFMLGQVLRGISPSAIPIETPIQVGLAVNLKAGAAIGLTVPAAVLARADEVIE